MVLVSLTAACAAPGRTTTSPSTALPSASPSPSASSNPSPSPTPDVTAGTITTCPAAVRNISGAYSFLCPTGWNFANCEETTGSGAYTWLVNPSAICLTEMYGARMLIVSEAGDHSADPENHQGLYVGERQSSQAVTVAGVGGTRRTYLVTASNPLPPPKNTVQVLYTLVTGGRTYFGLYNRYPGEPDLAADFDRMVTATFRFSA